MRGQVRFDGVDYSVVGAWESAKTNIDHQKSSHYFLSPSLLWKPTKTTEILVSTEHSKSKQNGNLIIVWGIRKMQKSQ